MPPKEVAAQNNNKIQPGMLSGLRVFLLSVVVVKDLMRGARAPATLFVGDEVQVSPSHGNCWMEIYD